MTPNGSGEGETCVVGLVEKIFERKSPTVSWVRVMKKEEKHQLTMYFADCPVRLALQISLQNAIRWSSTRRTKATESPMRGAPHPSARPYFASKFNDCACWTSNVCRCGSKSMEQSTPYNGCEWFQSIKLTFRITFFQNRLKSSQKKDSLGKLESTKQPDQ